MADRWSRGSEWRKWDLHLHAPGTRLSDNYRSNSTQDVWEEYCQRLRKSDVQVFGITDYFSADGYFATVAEYRKRFGDCPKLFLPNIELRTNDVVNKDAQHVHVHLLFNPLQPDFEDRLRRVLSLLRTNRTDAQSRTITVAELQGKDDLESATTTRDGICEALRTVYGLAADLTEHVLIFCAVNDGGIRTSAGTSGAKRKAEISDEWDKASDALFGNANNREYYLDPKRLNNGDLIRPKPVISGCDAHSFEDLDLRLGRVAYNEKNGVVFEPTWIKADLTFDGLRQILFEPEGRVFIGLEPAVEQRVRSSSNKYVESLHVTSVAGYGGRFGSWFVDEELVFNKELVAIIGNKGSGKSAIADVIGLLGNTHNQKHPPKDDELFSFLTKEKFRKGNCAANFRAELRWHDGTSTALTLDRDTQLARPELVEYLPQKYLERICANIADDEFRSNLNEVIFEYVAPEDRYEQPDLAQLIAYLSKTASDDIRLRKNDLHTANETVVSLESKLTDDHRTTLEGMLVERRRDHDSHIATKPAEPTPPNPNEQDSEAAEELESLNQRISEIAQLEPTLRQEQASAKKSVGDLTRIRRDIERLISSRDSIESTHGPTLAANGLSLDAILNIAVDYSSLDRIVAQHSDRIAQIASSLLATEDIEKIVGLEERKAAADQSIIHERDQLEIRKAQIVDRLGAPQRDFQAKTDALAAWAAKESEILGDEQEPADGTVRGLEREIDRLTSHYPSTLAEAVRARNDVARDIFRRKVGLTTFYESVKQSIDAEISKNRAALGTYDISIHAGLRFDPDFFKEFFRRVSQNAKGSFYGIEDGNTALKAICDEVENWEQEAAALNALESIADALHFDKREGFDDKNQPRNVFRQLRTNQSLTDLYDYLFGFDYLVPKYDLMVDGKDLSELSPGERGGLLLIFYLMLDKRDIPLVIDQPEDNLDNESVYQILATFLKKAKKRRQIIMVTHNPNLAVGADAEQLIRVRIDKLQGQNDFDFYSGSIENDKLNRAVVDILEGTLPAFDNRRLKYRRH